ncbi:hypothetical protein DFP72DRAFT_942296, partial [Ephemerocybe angulata]
MCPAVCTGHSWVLPGYSWAIPGVTGCRRANDGRTGDAWGAIYWVWSGVGWRMDAAGEILVITGGLPDGAPGSIWSVTGRAICWILPGRLCTGATSHWKLCVSERLNALLSRQNRRPGFSYL